MGRRTPRSIRSIRSIAPLLGQPAGQPDTISTTLMALPARYHQSGTAEERAELAVAQASWLMRLATLDPRTPRYAEQVTTDDLYQALRVLRGLFDLKQSSSSNLSLWGAIHWASIILSLADEAEADGRVPPLPLPYLFVARPDLDALEAADALVGQETLRPRTTRRRRAQKDKPVP